jgi:hypothetical protein
VDKRYGCAGAQAAKLVCSEVESEGAVIASNSTAQNALLYERNFAGLSLRAVFAKQSHPWTKIGIASTGKACPERSEWERRFRNDTPIEIAALRKP